MSSVIASNLTFPDPPKLDHPVIAEQTGIFIAHPAWPESQDVFLILDALDNPEQATCDSRTVWLASAIVAGNSFAGYLSTSRDPTHEQERIRAGGNDFLKAGKYWFHVPDPALPQDGPITSPYMYPICTSFNDWWYPHLEVPEFWPLNLPPQDPSISSDVSAIVRNEVCGVTSHVTGIQAAHVCPRAEERWFMGNNMDFYVRNGINAGPNLLALRADIHLSFDMGHFVFVPKGDVGLVIHFLAPLKDLTPLYNNQKLPPTPRLSGQMLFVRFAWAIFKRVRHINRDFSHRVWSEKGKYLDLPDSGPGKGKAARKRPASGPANGEGPQKATRSSTGRGGSRGKVKRTVIAEGEREDYYYSTPEEELDTEMRRSGLKSPTPETPRSMSTDDFSQPDCEHREERHDRQVLERVCPGLHEVEDPSELDHSARRLYGDIVVYPGYRRTERMKEKALAEQRPKEYNPADDDKLEEFEMEV